MRLSPALFEVYGRQRPAVLYGLEHLPPLACDRVLDGYNLKFFHTPILPVIVSVVTLPRRVFSILGFPSTRGQILPQVCMQR